MPDTLDHPPFEAYCGKESYIFASYSHRDSSEVFRELDRLHKSGYRIWYDEGIDPGSEWPDEVANALCECDFFLVFVSKNAIDSKNVKNEINFALNKGKTFLAVHLSETALPPGLELRMGDIQAILRHQMRRESYERKLDMALPLATRGQIEIQKTAAPEPIVERLARAFHEIYCQQRSRDGWRFGPEFNAQLKQSPLLVEFSVLPVFEQQANRNQVRAIPELLAKADCYLAFGADSVNADDYSSELVERVARAEHDRWVALKAANEWRWGKSRDDPRRLHPCILPWIEGELSAYAGYSERLGEGELPQDEKEKDRISALQTLNILAHAGFTIMKK